MPILIRSSRSQRATRDWSASTGACTCRYDRWTLNCVGSKDWRLASSRLSRIPRSKHKRAINQPRHRLPSHHQVMLYLTRRPRAPPPPVSLQVPPVSQQVRWPVREPHVLFERRACLRMEVAVMALQRRRLCRGVTTISCCGASAGQRSRKRIPPCVPSCGRNTRSTVWGLRRSDDRWRFVSLAVPARDRRLLIAQNTVRPFKPLVRYWTSGTFDGREACLGLSGRAQMSHTGTSTAPSGPIRS